MIPHKELRIGNWVSSPTKGYTQVEGICIQDDMVVVQTSHIEEIIAEDLTPIPLTHERLESVGFEVRGQSEYWKLFILPNGWYISQWVNAKPMEGFEETSKFYYGESYMKVEYLHDLQNLAFAFTREELTIKNLTV